LEAMPLANGRNEGLYILRKSGIELARKCVLARGRIQDLRRIGCL